MKPDSFDENQVGAQSREVFFILFQSAAFHFWILDSLPQAFADSFTPSCIPKKILVDTR